MVFAQRLDSMPEVFSTLIESVILFSVPVTGCLKTQAKPISRFLKIYLCRIVETPEIIYRSFSLLRSSLVVLGVLIKASSRSNAGV